MTLWGSWEKRTNRHAVFWWIMLWVQFAALALAYYAGFLTRMYQVDGSYLCVTILGIHFLCSIKIGLDTFKSTATNLRYFEYVEKLVVRMGLLGTIIGFIIVMEGSFATGIPTGVAGIVKVVNNMIVGLGTAFWTTAVGIVSAILLDLQTTNLEEATGGEEDKG